MGSFEEEMAGNKSRFSISIHDFLSSYGQIKTQLSIKISGTLLAGLQNHFTTNWTLWQWKSSGVYFTLRGEFIKFIFVMGLNCSREHIIQRAMGAHL
jgi:hypothetical protein